VWLFRQDEIGKDKITFKKIADKKDGILSFLQHGENIYFLSDKASPSYTIHQSTLQNPLFAGAQKLIATINEPIREFGVTTDKILYVETIGVIAKVFSLSLKKDAKPVEIQLPFSSYIYELKRPMKVGRDILLPLESWTRPTELWLFDGIKDKFVNTNLGPRGNIALFQNLVVEEIYIASHDGVMVPLSIIYDKKFKRNPANPAWLLAYGSYGTVLSPYYMPEELIKCRYGVVWAIAHVRGGGELGKEWHEAGKKEKKPNTWKDFIACGEYLAKEGFTSKEKLIAEGGSAGGITVGRAITERPDLFAVCVPVVGDLDKLVEPNLGPFNTREFGSINDPANYNHLLQMSPYRKIVKEEKYPAQLIMMGWNDPRIAPWQGGKFAARMQASSFSGKPVLLHVDFTGGHTGGDNLKASANKITFALWQTGHPLFKYKY